MKKISLLCLVFAFSSFAKEKIVFKDNHGQGLYWTAPLEPGWHYTNEADGIAKYAAWGFLNAKKACEDLGMRLPSVEEYSDLFSNFDHKTSMFGSKYLTGSGLKQMEKYFGPLKPIASGLLPRFWTSERDRLDSGEGLAVVARLTEDPIIHPDIVAGSVMCVK